MIPYQTPEEAWAQVKIEKMKHYEKEQCLEPEEQLDKLHKTIQEYYVDPLDNKLEIQVMHTRHTNPRVAIQDPNLWLLVKFQQLSIIIIIIIIIIYHEDRIDSGRNCNCRYIG